MSMHLPMRAQWLLYLSALSELARRCDKSRLRQTATTRWKGI